MDSARLTFPPNRTRETVAEHMKKKRMDAVLMTTSDGRVIDRVRHEDTQWCHGVAKRTFRLYFQELIRHDYRFLIRTRWI